jgi:hypothetical protein
MTLFLQELTKKLAEKWLTLLVLPGLLLVGTTAVGLLLGRARWADYQRLASESTAMAQELTARGPVAIILVVVAVLLGSAAAGLVATTLRSIVQWLWLGDWPRWAGVIGQPLVAMRCRRWWQADAPYAQELISQQRGDSTRDTDLLDRLARARNRIALAEPARPTWIGDRMAAVDARVLAEYQLDLSSAWPRLWLLVSDATRGEVQTAGTAFDAATTLAGWSWLYLVLGVIWWPAAVIGAVALTCAWVRGRATINVYAELVESVVDLHLRLLADALQLSEKPIDELGAEITSRLRKGV